MNKNKQVLILVTEPEYIPTKGYPRSEGNPW